MALTEFNSLQYLYRKFKQHDDGSIGTIRPLDYLSEFNAILTEGVPEGIEVYELFRVHGYSKNVDNYILS